MVSWAGEVSSEKTADFAVLIAAAVMTTVSGFEGEAAMALKLAVV
jgi:hypothetical protein